MSSPLPPCLSFFLDEFPLCPSQPSPPLRPSLVLDVFSCQLLSECRESVEEGHPQRGLVCLRVCVRAYVCVRVRARVCVRVEVEK